MKYVRVERRPGSWIRRQKYWKPSCPFLSSTVRNYCKYDTIRNSIDHIVFTTKEEHHDFCSACKGVPHYFIYPTFEVTTPSFNKILIETTGILLFYFERSGHGTKFGFWRCPPGRGGSAMPGSRRLNAACKNANWENLLKTVTCGTDEFGNNDVTE